MSDSFDSCEIVAIYIEKINTINIVIYRPPDAGTLAFNKVIDKTKTILENMDKPEHNVIITGDFNFRFVKWKRGIHGGCRWEKTGATMTRDERDQFTKLIELTDKYNLVQAIEEPTRERNTLDLVFTNDISMFTHIEVTKSNLSDHNQIKITFLK